MNKNSLVPLLLSALLNIVVIVAACIIDIRKGLGLILLYGALAAIFVGLMLKETNSK